jgi:nucleotide-binding universal stress UspA family protein
MSCYKRGAVALDFKTGNAQALFAQAREMVTEDQLYLVHAVRLEGARHDLDFDVGSLEAEYWKCETYLSQWGDEFNIPKSRQMLLVGPIAQRINEFVRDHGVEVLVMGAEEEASAAAYPIDVASGVMANAQCDLLLIGQT